MVSEEDGGRIHISKENLKALELIMNIRGYPDIREALEDIVRRYAGEIPRKGEGRSDGATLEIDPDVWKTLTRIRDRLGLSDMNSIIESCILTLLVKDMIPALVGRKEKEKYLFMIQKIKNWRNAILEENESVSTPTEENEPEIIPLEETGSSEEEQAGDERNGLHFSGFRCVLCTTFTTERETEMVHHLTGYHGIMDEDEIFDVMERSSPPDEDYPCIVPLEAAAYYTSLTHVHEDLTKIESLISRILDRNGEIKREGERIILHLGKGTRVEGDECISEVQRLARCIQAKLYWGERLEKTMPLHAFLKKHELTWEETLMFLEVLSLSIESLSMGDEFFWNIGTRGLRSSARGKNLICRMSILLGRDKEEFKPMLEKNGKLRRRGLIVVTARGTGLNYLDHTFGVNRELLPEICGDEFDDGEVKYAGAKDEPYELRDPCITLDDMILPEKTGEKLRVAIAHAESREKILQCIRLKGDRGAGTTMLFTGPPGTGKTMAAEAIANHLKKRYILVNYAKLVNCFAGQTEKAILQVFQAAERHDAVLVIDEADAILYPRGEKEESWSNRWVNLLLQCIERFKGVLILTTNFAINLDRALERRIRIKIEFEVPDATLRERILRSLLREEYLAADVDLKTLAEAYPFSGGQILNMVQNAVSLAVIRTGNGEVKVTMDDLIRGARMELEGGDSMKYTMKDETRVDGYG